MYLDEWGANDLTRRPFLSPIVHSSSLIDGRLPRTASNVASYRMYKQLFDDSLTAVEAYQRFELGIPSRVGVGWRLTDRRNPVRACLASFPPSTETLRTD